MKQFFSILSSIIFLFGAAGYYFAFTIADEHVKKEMTQTIQSADHKQTVVQLTFSKTELGKEVRFTKTDQREFIYGGQLYDVINMQEVGENVLFTCMADKKETSLFTEFGKQLTEQSSGNNTSGKTSAKSLMPDWFFQNSFSEIPIETFKLTLSKEISFLSNIPLEIPSPPPKC